MHVWSNIVNMIKNGPVHMTLLDPEKESPETAAVKAKVTEKYGSSIIMLGGSTGVSKEHLDKVAISIKRATSLPIILFPGSASSVTEVADAIYFMSLLNSNSVDYIIRHQMKAAPYIKKYNIETISMGYIVIEPGMTVGTVGKAELIRREDVDTAVRYAIAAEFFGMKVVYLEAGSGSPEPVPPDMIKTVKNNISIPVIVGGGIRSPDIARKIIDAGANIIVTGTLVEEDDYSALREIIDLTKGK
ncbi:MAG: geranylgeranylglyceryl/heptaprenylglyceryl phosphate synthase [Candidatus Thermoplasmatota archaeon]|nr:geranylgeranylglyceryl/heptaprenylglyceryl phosphate synthase [Candidatus Thermoplasmatota archaeon]MCL5963150.1 geranylgeranylglyceryl/heptaprenylglyceryl phosphate synthase [Candidatus Thermoplasmatota archaeon]